MSDRNDDNVADDEQSTAGTPSTPTDGDPEETAPGDGETTDEPPSVAAAAGIDDDVLDSPRELASTVRLQWILRSTVGAAVFGAIVAGITLVAGGATDVVPAGRSTAVTAGVGVFLLAAVYGVLKAVLLYRSWEYVVREDSLYLRRGVFTRVRTVVPYVRVQHIDTTRSPLERLLGLSTLVVYTAGSRGADVTIPGLTPERASTLQTRLERLAIESEEADAV
ncbi:MULTISPECIES: PH domain-containing protein [Halolamina]|uniref:PH domain-containing protein n=1 Tax=Halolamina TaxID=1075397 RepID=UPI00373FD355